MRILSQEEIKEIFDIPYEQCELHMYHDEIFSDNYVIFARSASGKGYKMAKYSTEEKAVKALEMLQKAYSPILVMKETENGIEPNIKPNDFIVGSLSPMPKVEVLDNFYFRFPNDDEVEV